MALTKKGQDLFKDSVTEALDKVTLTKRGKCTDCVTKVIYIEIWKKRG